MEGLGWDGVMGGRSGSVEALSFGGQVDGRLEVLGPVEVVERNSSVVGKGDL